jgi:FMN phosphatase YigB (HAD superfamily)
MLDRQLGDRVERGAVGSNIGNIVDYIIQNEADSSSFIRRHNPGISAIMGMFGGASNPESPLHKNKIRTITLIMMAIFEQQRKMLEVEEFLRLISMTAVDILQDPIWQKTLSIYEKIKERKKQIEEPVSYVKPQSKNESVGTREWMSCIDVSNKDPEEKIEVEEAVQVIAKSIVINLTELQKLVGKNKDNIFWELMDKHPEIKRKFIQAGYNWEKMEASEAKLCRSISKIAEYLEKSGKDFVPEFTEKDPNIEYISDLEEVVEIAKNDPKNKVVSFDFMDTLVEWKENVNERRRKKAVKGWEVMRENGVIMSQDEYFRIQKSRIDKWKREYHGKGGDFLIVDAMKEVVEDCYRFTGKGVSKNTRNQIAQKVSDKFEEVEMEEMVPTMHAQATLQKLKECGKGVVVYSNTYYSGKFIQKALKKMGLGMYIDHIFASSETNAIKSDKSSGAYEKIVNHFKEKKYEKESFLHIGDQKVADYQGAKKYGMNARCYKNPKRFSRLDGVKAGEEEYARTKYELIGKRMTQDAKEYMVKVLGREKEKKEDVREVAMRAYEVARDIYGPLVARFSAKVFEEMEKDPEMSIFCLGRDSLPMMVIMKALLRHDERKILGEIDSSRIQHAAVSRKIAYKVVHDAGMEPWAYIKDTPDFKKVKNENYHGYEDALRGYLKELGFEDAKKVTVIDTGNSGTFQTLLHKMYPNKNIEGKYLYVTKREDDPAADKKEGYLYENNRGKESGNKLYIHQKAIHIIEDLFNGTFESSTRILEKERGGKKRFTPEKKRLTPVTGSLTDPERLPEDFRDFEVYEVIKKMILKGFVDSARMYLAQRTVDPDGKYGILKTDQKVEQGYSQYVRDFVESRNGGQKMQKKDEILCQFLVREASESSPRMVDNRQKWEAIGLEKNR